MLTPALRRAIRHDASIATQTTTSGGVRTTPAHLFDLKIAPIDAVDPDVALRFSLQSPVQARQTFAYTKDRISTGHYLVFGGRSYPIKGLAPYPDDDGFVFYHIIIEDIISK